MPTASPRDTALVTTARVDLRDNDVALGVSGNHAENLKAIERRLGVRVGQRGTELHLSGPADAVASAVRLVEQLETILRAGQPVGREDVEQGLKMLGRGASAEQGLDTLVLGPVLSRGGPPRRAQEPRAEALRRRHPPARHRLRHRPGRDREDLPGDGHGGRGAPGPQREADRPRPSGGGGGREAGLPPRGPGGEGEPVPPAALRRAPRHDGRRTGRPSWWSRGRWRSRRWPSCAAAR